jgi:hypothetical protein
VDYAEEGGMVKFPILLIAVAASMLLFGCVNTQSGSGLYGNVTLGPTCPVVRINDTSCADKPYQTTIVVMDQNRAAEITRFSSASDGTFNFTLKPGSYYLVPVQGSSPFPKCNEEFIAVADNDYTNVLIECDTGIK